MQDGDVVLLENLRFDPREEANDPAFARELAALADLYVNDAFGAAHRAHASTEGVAHLLPASLGLLMQREIDALSALLEEPGHPFVAIIGGAKVSDKLAVLQNLLDRVDHLLIGGGMANTFLLAKGHEVGKSLVERDLVDTAKDLITEAERRNVSIGLPTDVVVATSIDADSGDTGDLESIDAEQAIFDIGPESAAAYADIINGANTVFWNGPLGVAENPTFAHGTATVAHAVAQANGFTIIGGGDSVSAIEHLGLTGKIDHISTGGGASLEFLEGKSLPGIAAIPEAE
jgi:phosphoglycerate kinase